MSPPGKELPLDLKLNVRPAPESLLLPPVPVTNIRVVSGASGHILYVFCVQHDLLEHPGVLAEVEKSLAGIEPEPGKPILVTTALPSVGKFVMTTEALESLVGVLTVHLEGVRKHEAQAGGAS